MQTKLRKYFPLLKTRNEIRAIINVKPHLKKQFGNWSKEYQEDFLDFMTGAKGVKLLYDSFFKEIMNPEATPERLEEFLGLLLGKEVKIIEVLPGNSVRLGDEESLVYTDVMVKLEDGTLANIEIQKIGYLCPGQRAACYSSDMLLRQYKKVRSVANQQNKKFSYREMRDSYVIVLYEESPNEFCAYPKNYIHRFEQKSDTGLEMELLQKFTLPDEVRPPVGHELRDARGYVFVPLDIFKKNIQNGIKSDLVQPALNECMDRAG